MNVRRRDNPGKGDLGASIKGAVNQRKGGEGVAKPIRNAVGMRPKNVGYSKVRGAVSG